MNGLIEGRMVHFVTESGEHRPAIVVKVWNKEIGYCNLQVILDGRNAAKDNFSLEQLDRGIAWVTSVNYSEEVKPRTWHWIERD